MCSSHSAAPRKMRQDRWDAEHRFWCFPGLGCFLIWSRSVEPGCLVQALLLLVLRPLSELLRPLSIYICNMGTSILQVVLGKVFLGWSWLIENEWNSYLNIDSEKYTKLSFLEPASDFQPGWPETIPFLSSLNGYTSAVTVTWAAPWLWAMHRALCHLLIHLLSAILLKLLPSSYFLIFL